MPMYSWIDETTGKSVDIINSFDNSERPPLREQVDADMGDEEFGRAVWRKILNAPGVVKGYGWGGGKGNWSIWITASVAWASDLYRNIYLG